MMFIEINQFSYELKFHEKKMTLDDDLIIWYEIVDKISYFYTHIKKMCCFLIDLLGFHDECIILTVIDTFKWQREWNECYMTFHVKKRN